MSLAPLIAEFVAELNPKADLLMRAKPSTTFPPDHCESRANARAVRIASPFASCPASRHVGDATSRSVAPASTSPVDRPVGLATFISRWVTGDVGPAAARGLVRSVARREDEGGEGGADRLRDSLGQALDKEVLSRRACADRRSDAVACSVTPLGCPAVLRIGRCQLISSVVWVTR
jgi:hypothetical protein